MKLDDGFEMRTLAGFNIIVPSKVKDIDYTHVLTLNETATTIWKRMTEGEFETEDLVKAITDTYEVDEEQARKDAVEMLEKLRGLKMVLD